MPQAEKGGFVGMYKQSCVVPLPRNTCFSEEHPTAVGIIMAQLLTQSIGQVAAIVRADHHILTPTISLLQKAEKGLRVIQHIARKFFGIIHVGVHSTRSACAAQACSLPPQEFFALALAARGVYSRRVNRTELRRELRAAAEAGYAAFASKLLPDNTHTLLGVRLPRLRALARDIAKRASSHTFLARPLPQRASFEEIMVQGFVIGYMNDISFTERTALLDRLIPRLDNWSLCDSCCATYRFAAEHREEAWEWLLPYTRSAAVYERRFAVVMMLDHFLADTAWATRIAALLPTLPCGDYYADMATAWCACKLCLRYPPMAAGLLTALPAPVQKLTRRKLRESRRDM